MRKLATIRKILELSPIEGADNIEVALVDGWQRTPPTSHHMRQIKVEFVAPPFHCLSGYSKPF